MSESVVAVVGESLVDLIRQPSGEFRPFCGGSPYNVARALGRMGAPVSYLSPIGEDSLGDLLADALEAEGVRLPGARSTRPTSLALVTLDDAGQPAYALYREGVADRDVTAEELLARLPESTKVLHTGSLALVPGEIEKMMDLLREVRARGILVAVDVNMRPSVEPALETYVDGVLSLLPLCDLVKASDEDLEVLGLNGAPEELAAQVLERLGSPGLVAVTRGGEGALLVTPSATVSRGAWPIGVVADTVGAGDCFQAALLCALHRHGLLDGRGFVSASTEQLSEILDLARVAAALNVTRPGASPPTWAEVVGARSGG